MTRTAPDPNRVVVAVAASVFAQFLGATAVLPMLPLYLRARSLDVGLVGVVMGAFFVAGVVTQYAAGHLSDRVGHRRVMVAGLVVYAAASLGFLADVGAGGYTGLRALQGVGAGALQIAGLALIGVVVPLERRGRAFSTVFAAQLSGMAVGPLLGAAAGVAHMRLLFVLSAVTAVVAMTPVLGAKLPPSVRTTQATRERLRVSRGLVGVVVVGVAGGLGAGVYETCWSLLITSRHAAQWQVGLSWALFAVSFALFSPVAGRLSDRFDRRHLALAGVVVMTGFLLGYPFVPRAAWLVALGPFEALAVATAFPAAQSLMSQLVAPGALGRAQGLFTTVESAAIGVMAVASGYLFGMARWLPFLAGGAVATVLSALLPVLWRDVVGRAEDAAAEAGPAVAVDQPVAALAPSA